MSLPVISHHDETVSVKEAAELLNMRVTSVHRAILQDRLAVVEVAAPVNQFGRYYRIKRSEIERYRNTPKTRGPGRPRKPSIN